MASPYTACCHSMKKEKMMSSRSVFLCTFLCFFFIVVEEEEMKLAIHVYLLFFLCLLWISCIPAFRRSHPFPLGSFEKRNWKAGNTNSKIVCQESLSTIDFDLVKTISPCQFDSQLNSTILCSSYKAFISHSILYGFFLLLQTVVPILVPRFTFPIPLMGMIIIYLVLLGGSSIFPMQTHYVFTHYLLHMIMFNKAYLTLFFIPALVILPLKLTSFQSAVTLLSTVSILFLGWLFSCLSTAGIVLFLTDTFDASWVPDSTPNTAKTTSIPLLQPPAYPSQSVLFATIILCLSMKALLPSVVQVNNTLVNRFLEWMYHAIITLFSYVYSMQYGNDKVENNKQEMSGSSIAKSIFHALHPILRTTLLINLWLLVWSLLSSGSITYRTKSPLLWQDHFQNTLRNYYVLGSGQTGTSKVGIGDILAQFLQLIILSFGIQLYQYRGIIRKHMLMLLISTFLAAVGGIGSSIVLNQLFQLPKGALRKAMVTRCITTPLAIIGGSLIQADASLSALMVVVTGIFGTLWAKTVLKWMNRNIGNRLDKDDLQLGIAMDASAHGLGTAALVQEPSVFAIGVVSMTLTGLWTIMLLSKPQVRQFILRTCS